MSLEASLYDLLSPLVSGRVYPDVAPTNTARPYITYQQIGGESPWFVGRALPSKRNAEVQVNVWGTTRSAASALALQVESTLVAATSIDAHPVGALVADYDDDLGLYGTRQDFSVWADR